MYLNGLGAELIHTYMGVSRSLLFFKCLLLPQYLSYLYKITRMTTFIKTKFKISDYQTNIELILQPIIITNFCGSENHLR